jgi:hypothetical protein
MQLGSFGKVLFVIGSIGVIIGLFGSMFLSYTVAQVTVNSESEITSDIFYLKGGKPYSWVIAGYNWPAGGGSGIITVISYTGPLFSEQISIGFGFGGDVTERIMNYGQYSVPRSGEYYFVYSPAVSNIYTGSVKIILQEPMVQSITGFSDFEVIISSIFVTAVGGVLIFVEIRR